jgi:oxygen-dependent protoporphyrinogen oxidase
MPSHTDAIILGAGISGLTAGFYLAEQGFRVRILEKSPRVGGSIRSERRDGFLIEFGPNTVLESTPLLGELFEKLGIASERENASPQAKNRYIVRGGQLHALPTSPMAFLKTPLFSTAAKFRLLLEPFISRAPADREESLADFVTRRIGPEFLDYAINPFVAGVYAGDPAHLGIQSAFPKLHALEREHGSLIRGAILSARQRKKSGETPKSRAPMLGFQNGLQTLPDALHRALGDSIFTGCAIRQISRSDAGFSVALESGEILEAPALLSTVPAHTFSSLPIDFAQKLATTLDDITHPPVAMVFMGFDKPPGGIVRDGFGFLVPAKENRQILGCIWSSSIFEGRTPAGGAGLTTFVGGSRQPELARLSDSELGSLVLGELRALMGVTATPSLVAVQKWEKAIPQYRVGYGETMDAISNFENDTPGFFVSGNFRGGIAVPDCVKQSCAIADRISGFLSSRSVNTTQTQ